MSINRVNETEALGQERVGKLLFRLAAPAIAAQVINLLYNLVDRMYIGHIDLVGAQALTGLGVCLPLIMLITAFAALVSMGSAPRASIFLGKGDKESAGKNPWVQRKLAVHFLCNYNRRVSALVRAFASCLRGQ